VLSERHDVSLLDKKCLSRRIDLGGEDCITFQHPPCSFDSGPVNPSVLKPRYFRTRRGNLGKQICFGVIQCQKVGGRVLANLRGFSRDEASVPKEALVLM